MRLSEIHRMIGDEGEAFRFLETFKIVERIPRCPKGHEWNLVEKVNNGYLTVINTVRGSLSTRF